MDKNKAFWNSTMTWGALTGVALIVFQLIMYFIDPMSKSPVIQLITISIIFGGLFYGIKQFRDNFNGGFLEYGRGVGFGALMGCFAGLIVGFYTFLFYKFIDPTMIDQMMSMAEEAMLKQNPNMTDEQLDMALSITKKMMSPVSMLFLSILGTAFWSTLISLIVAAIHKRKDPSWESNFDQ